MGGGRKGINPVHPYYVAGGGGRAWGKIRQAGTHEGEWVVVNPAVGSRNEEGEERDLEDVDGAVRGGRRAFFERRGILAFLHDRSVPTNGCRCGQAPKVAGRFEEHRWSREGKRRCSARGSRTSSARVAFQPHTPEFALFVPLPGARMLLFSAAAAGQSLISELVPAYAPGAAGQSLCRPSADPPLTINPKPQESSKKGHNSEVDGRASRLLLLCCHTHAAKLNCTAYVEDPQMGGVKGFQEIARRYGCYACAKSRNNVKNQRMCEVKK